MIGFLCRALGCSHTTRLSAMLLSSEARTVLRLIGQSPQREMEDVGVLWRAAEAAERTQRTGTYMEEAILRRVNMQLQLMRACSHAGLSILSGERISAVTLQCPCQAGAL